MINSAKKIFDKSQKYKNTCKKKSLLIDIACVTNSESTP